MNVKKENIQEYLDASQRYEANKLKLALASEKRAWLCFSLVATIAILSIISNVLMMPLKTVEPYLIRVDNSTGIVDTVNTMQEAKTNYEETVNKYFVQLYVRYREGYTLETREENYKNIGLMSDHLEQEKYYKWFSPANPSSPIILYKNDEKVKIQVKSVSFIKDNLALVRYLKNIEIGKNATTTHWVATIAFKYVTGAIADSTRIVNPLGFQVTEYTNNPEAEHVELLGEDKKNQNPK